MLSPSGRAFSGEPSERSEQAERMRGRRVRRNAMVSVRAASSRFQSPRRMRSSRESAALGRRNIVASYGGVLKGDGLKLTNAADSAADGHRVTGAERRDVRPYWPL